MTISIEESKDLNLLEKFELFNLEIMIIFLRKELDKIESDESYYGDIFTEMQVYKNIATKLKQEIDLYSKTPFFVSELNDKIELILNLITKIEVEISYNEALSGEIEDL